MVYGWFPYGGDFQRFPAVDKDELTGEAPLFVAEYAALPQPAEASLKSKDSSDPLLSFGSAVVGPEVADNFCFWRELTLKDHSQEDGPSWKAPGNPLPSSSRSHNQKLIQ